MSLYYKPTREYRTPGDRQACVRECREGDEPEMYSVYFRDEDGPSEWVADFINEDDARLFIKAKE